MTFYSSYCSTLVSAALTSDSFASASVLAVDAASFYVFAYASTATAASSLAYAAALSSSDMSDLASTA